MSSVLCRINRKLPPGLRRTGLWTFAAKCILPLDTTLKKELDAEAARYHKEQPYCAEKKIRQDMLRTYLLEDFSLDEYCRFRLFQKSASERKAYYGKKEAKRFRQSLNIFPQDKFERYQLFQDYFRREIVEIRFGENDADDKYRSFCERHESFVAKPSIGTKGKGVCFVAAKDVPTLKELYDLMGGDCLLEEAIEQGNELAVFHPSSVNTLRIATAVNNQGEIVPLFAMLRTGRGNSIVDNVGSGGIISLVDLSTGVVLSDGLCGREWFEVHPDTGVRFKGVKIPEWDEVCRIAAEAHQTYLKQRLIGWDFAWTKNGWDVVEVNPAPDFPSIQVLMGRGIRPEIESVFGKK